MTSHEAVCILNAGDETAHIEITLYYEAREPGGPYKFDIAPRRSCHLRFNNFKDPEPDQGIWESRKAPRQYVYSKAMCWTALDRALRLASLGGRTFDPTLWVYERDSILEAIGTNGFDTALGAFVQAYARRRWMRQSCACPCRASCGRTIRACFPR